MGKVFVRYICAYCILVTAKETINYMINAVWSRSAVLYEMNLRQATPEGTLAAAAERLGFLRDLGIDAVWLMPHYPIGEVGRKGSLGSYYSIRDYRAVNPEFGTMADFDVFVRRAHALGMKVLIDWVANHTSRAPAGSRNVRPTGTNGTLRAGPSFLTGGMTRPSLITPIGPSGRDRSTPCVFGLRNTGWTVFAAIWRCWFPSNFGRRRHGGCGR